MSIKGDYPIILAHGICRFDHLLNKAFGLDNRDDDRWHYFKRIRSTLIADGFTVFHSGVDFAAGVETRADQLKAQIEQHTNGIRDHARVHIIAHSMGGLDARHMIYRHRMEDRVASLTTIGTPHHGTSFADRGLERTGELADVITRLGLNVDGFKDLTTQRCRTFNEEARAFENSNGVKYQTFTGTQPRNQILPLLWMPFDVIIEEGEGPNDGLVSLESAKWRDDVFRERWDADHLNEIGWWDIGDALTSPNFLSYERNIRNHYLEIAREL
ncbi:MAG: hypothetical protein PVI86_13345 [Phycisphaerae bacterium]|jgi:triacylglycerol lipase